ncbi:hypothetical protein BU17DRAFT_64164 [Hysterangium stoloniferum]|nr:hypothetical protein BU17DRAFT_64164 [Hysterangium stoloniferum]
MTTTDFNIDLLSTELHSESLESQSLKVQLEQQRAELSSVDDRINILLEELEILRSRKERLRKSISIGDSLFAPIRKIPTEILRDIMTLTVPGFFSQDFVYDMVATFRDVSVHLAEPHHARGRLTGVCRLWREQVKKIPRIWSTINISRDMYLNGSIIEERFRLAKGCPIDLCLWPKTWFRDADSTSRAALIKTVTLIVKSHINQIRVLIIDTEDLSSAECASLLQLFPSQALVDLPALEVLCIADDEGLLNQNIPTIQAPSLSWLSVDNYGVNIFNQLTDDSIASLEQVMISSREEIPYDSISRLSLCPNLIALHWSHYESIGGEDSESDSDEAIASQERLHLPSLQTLCLYIESPDRMEQQRLVRRLQTPTLVSLTFCGGGISDIATHALSIILTSGLPYLQHLSLKEFTIDDNGHSKLFDGLPQLRTISCTFCHFGASFFSGLAPVAVGKIPACPLLEALSLARTHFHVPEIIRLVKTRAVPWNGSGGSALQRVHVARCRTTVPKAQKDELRRLQESYGHVLIIEHSIH